MNSELKNSQVALIGISNTLIFTEQLDPRVKSSLSEEEVIFPPYNALQIQDILKQRVKEAFQSNAISPGVIEKCAAYAAREHGDARRALDLLRVAGEIADRKGLSSVVIENLDEAEEKIEHDRILDIVVSQPKQFQATLYALLKISRTNNIGTGDIYSNYRKICNLTGLRPLTQRRISDIIQELDMLGVITTKVISKGRYGRTREISLAISPQIKTKVEQIIKADLSL